jgi:hypothetical protein
MKELHQVAIGSKNIQTEQVLMTDCSPSNQDEMVSHFSQKKRLEHGQPDACNGFGVITPSTNQKTPSPGYS